MRRFVFVSLICASILAMTACGSTPATTPSPGNTATTIESGVLRVAALYDISTMDVSQTTDDYMVPMNVFDRLFESEVQSDGSTAIVSSLCESYLASDDGLTYTFTLKDGIVFSNGNALTADDVQYTFERLLTAGGVNDDIPLEVVGAEALQNGEADTLEGFAVIDDTHFSITLNTANAGFLAELTSPAMSIVDKETVESVANFGLSCEDNNFQNDTFFHAITLFYQIPVCCSNFAFKLYHKTCEQFYRNFGIYEKSPNIFRPGGLGINHRSA